MGSQSDRERTEQIDWDNIQNIPTLSALQFRTPGNYYSSSSGGGMTTQVLQVNTLYAFPFIVSKDTELFDKITIEVTTLEAAKSIRLGIYKNIFDGVFPSTLILDAGVVSAATTGVKEISVTLNLTPGLYWLAAITDGTPTVRAVSITLGQLIIGLTNTIGSWHPTGYGFAMAYATLPLIFSSLARNVTGDYPFVWLRKVS